MARWTNRRNIGKQKSGPCNSVLEIPGAAGVETDAEMPRGTNLKVKFMRDNRQRICFLSSSSTELQQSGSTSFTLLGEMVREEGSRNFAKRDNWATFSARGPEDLVKLVYERRAGKRTM